MIEKLMQAVDYNNFENDIFLQFTSFQQHWDGVTFTCSIFSEEGDGGKLVDQWQIDCSNVEEYQLFYLDTYERENFEFTDDHPYLWDYQKPFTELYFKGETTDAKALIGALYLEHNRLSNGLIPFRRYLNAEEAGFKHNLEELLTGKHGLFSTAPEPLNQAYQELLSKYGFATSLLTRKAAPPCKDCRLLRLGKSFIIAKKFSASRIAAENWHL